MAKFDIKTEATKTFYAGAGVADIAVETVRDYVSDVQAKLTGVQKDVTTRVNDLDYSPQALREQATGVVNARVDALAKDAKARRTAVEKRVAELQTEAGDTYGDLVQRGETLVGRIRRQESTRATTRSAQTASTKAKTTRTQATKGAKSTARKTATTAKTTAKKKAPATKSSAKATGTAAKQTASNAARATGDAAAKVGD